MTIEEQAEAIMRAILADVTGRSGWENEWDGFDEDIQGEIRDTWRKTIAGLLRGFNASL